MSETLRKPAGSHSSGNAQWYYALSGERLGPLSARELKALAETGDITPETLVWKPGFKDWVPARKIKNLFSSEALRALAERETLAELSHGTAMKDCPFCAEHINANAKKCRYCGEFLAPAESPRNATPPVVENAAGGDDHTISQPATAIERAIGKSLPFILPLARRLHAPLSVVFAAALLVGCGLLGVGSGLFRLAQDFTAVPILVQGSLLILLAWGCIRRSRFLRVFTTLVSGLLILGGVWLLSFAGAGGATALIGLLPIGIGIGVLVPLLQRHVGKWFGLPSKAHQGPSAIEQSVGGLFSAADPNRPTGVIISAVLMGAIAVIGLITLTVAVVTSEVDRAGFMVGCASHGLGLLLAWLGTRPGRAGRILLRTWAALHVLAGACTLVSDARLYGPAVQLDYVVGVLGYSLAILWFASGAISFHLLGFAHILEWYGVHAEVRGGSSMATGARRATSVPMMCPVCHRTSAPGTVVCVNCGYNFQSGRSVLDERRSGGETLGVLMLVAPVVATVLVWLWVGNMNLLQHPSETLLGILIVTILLTAILAAVEAEQLGLKPGGVRWFFGHALLWIAAYPYYQYARSKAGAKNRCIFGIVVMLVFLGSTALMGSAIERWKQETADIFAGGPFDSSSGPDRDQGRAAPAATGETTTPPPAPQEQESGFEILEIDARMTSSNEIFVEVAWKVRLQNLTHRSQRYTAHIKFLDDDDFLVHEDFEFDLRLGAHETDTFSYKTMMEPEKWRKLARYNVQVREQ